MAIHAFGNVNPRPLSHWVHRYYLREQHAIHYLRGTTWSSLMLPSRGGKFGKAQSMPCPCYFWTHETAALFPSRALRHKLGYNILPWCLLTFQYLPHHHTVFIVWNVLFSFVCIRPSISPLETQTSVRVNLEERMCIRMRIYHKVWEQFYTNEIRPMKNEDSTLHRGLQCWETTWPKNALRALDGSQEVPTSTIFDEATKTCGVHQGLYITTMTVEIQFARVETWGRLEWIAKFENTETQNSNGPVYQIWRAFYNRKVQMLWG